MSRTQATDEGTEALLTALAGAERAEHASREAWAAAKRAADSHPPEGELRTSAAEAVRRSGSAMWQLRLLRLERFGLGAVSRFQRLGAFARSRAGDDRGAREASALVTATVAALPVAALCLLIRPHPLTFLVAFLGAVVLLAACAFVLAVPRWVAWVDARLAQNADRAATAQREFREASTEYHISIERLRVVERAQACQGAFEAARAETARLRAELGEQERQIVEAAQRAQEEEAAAARRAEQEEERRRSDLAARRSALVRSNWRDLRGVAFEQFLRDVFELLGYSVRLTKTSGDQGVDLIVSGQGRLIAVQAKGYDGSVDNTPVQEVFAGMVHYSCRECAAITNSSFTSGAEELAASVGCRLIDGSLIPTLIQGRIY